MNSDGRRITRLSGILVVAMFIIMAGDVYALWHGLATTWLAKTGAALILFYAAEVFVIGILFLLFFDRRRA